MFFLYEREEEKEGKEERQIFDRFLLFHDPPAPGSQLARITDAHNCTWYVQDGPGMNPIQLSSFLGGDTTCVPQWLGQS